MELFGQYILDGNKKTEMLGIFDYQAERSFDKRLNYIVLAQFEEIPIVAVKSQFSVIKGINENHFLKMERDSETALMMNTKEFIT